MGRKRLDGTLQKNRMSIRNYGAAVHETSNAAGATAHAELTGAADTGHAGGVLEP